MNNNTGMADNNIRKLGNYNTKDRKDYISDLKKPKNNINTEVNGSITNDDMDKLDKNYI